MRATFCLLLAVAFLAPPPVRAEKTDLARESYIENSEVDFTLTVKDASAAGGKVRVFEVSAPQSGDFTLLCFVDGKFFRREPAKLPGKYSLSVRGLSKGTHKVTIQVVDKNGRVGRFTQDVVVGN
ncbi:MAG TPA: hypothetical protein VEL06_16285 [Haliangiales bacterium]|nr:hypothetical protein [Haliangiales bacterium]